MKIIKILILLVFFAVFSSSVLAIIIDFPDGSGSFCGDEICDDLEGYNESDYNTIYYCPYDCGVTDFDEDWCLDTFSSLTRSTECSSSGGCPTCETCTIDRVSESSLTSYCESHYSSSSSSNGLGSSGGSTLTLKNFIYWIVFLIIGLILGYLIWHKKKKKRRG